MVEPVTLAGQVVRLEPLTLDHIPDLLAAAGEDRATYGWSTVPDGDAATREYVDVALQGRAEGHMLPFATVRRDDDRVVGCTRFARMERWAWPPGHPLQRHDVPDAVEIGYTWLAAS